jgi:HD-GYP domain-containing protein (c-di-GMP phosphodiesterase class II)
LQQQVGLDSNDALNAKIYSDTKKIESLLLESSSQLQLLAFSELNVHFKDFLFSHSLVSIENFKNHLLQIKEIFLKTTNMSDVDKKVLLTTLQSYKNNIFNLVSIEVKKGLNEQSGIHRQMRKLAHEVEGIQEHMLSEYKDLLTFENDKLKLKLLLMIIIVMLFSIIGATLFANKITDNIKKLEYGLLDFFEYLNKKKKRVPRININSDDEIGVMANLINDNISKAIEMLKYERKSTKFIQDVNQEIIDTQKELLNTVGTISETRSRETGQHVKRVALYSKLLAKKLNLPKKEINLIELASPMHDIGKIGIPDSILNKPGKLTKDEFEIMKTHAQIGFDMLKHSKREIIQAAAVIAYEHHEKYDGSGYPNARVGEQIHIFGRITALADVFDALGSDRCYKEAWELDRILAFIKDERGKHFDPKLVDIFFDNLDEFLDIQRRYKEVNVEEKLLV